MQVVFLYVISVFIRASGGALRVGSRRIGRAFGWVLCATAIWFVMDAAGTWFPIWPVVLLGIAGAVLDDRLNRKAIWIIGDVSIVVMAGFLSMPSLGFFLVAGIALAVAVSGLIIDTLLIKTTRKIQIAVFTIPIIGLSLATVKYPWLVRPTIYFIKNSLHWNSFMYTGMTPARAQEGERILLETGAVAWLKTPPGPGPFPGALLFHGADPLGSRQPAVVAMRHALLNAGVAVLAIDHPGYGQSPSPTSVSDISQWDPLPTAVAGLKKLRAFPGINSVFVVGHSMGSTDALRLLAEDKSLRGGILLGATAGDIEEDMKQEKRFYNLFHKERRMNYLISPSMVREIRRRFYNDGTMLGKLTNDHAPILFIRFGLEFQDIAATRDSMYNAIPGRKLIWDLQDSTHFINSYEFKGFVFGDTSTTRRLSKRFRQFVNEVPHDEKTDLYYRSKYYQFAQK